MTSNRSKEWRDEFDNDFAGAICGGDGLVDSQLKNDIKDWFEGELDTQRAELIERVEGMKKQNITPWSECSESDEFEDIGYNQAISNVLQLLKGEK